MFGLGIQGFGGIDTEFGTNTASRGRVEFRGAAIGLKNQVFVRLESGGNGPVDLGGIVDVDVLIHHHDHLHIVVHGQCTEDDVLRRTFVDFLDLNNQVVAPYATFGQMHIQDIWKNPLHVGEETRFSGDSTQHEVLRATTNDGVKQRGLSVRDGRDFNDKALAFGPIVLCELPKWAFRFTHPRHKKSLDGYFSLRGNHEIVADGLHHLQRLAMQSPRHLQFILVLAHQGLGSQQGHHIYTNDNGDGHGFALSFRLGQKSTRVSR